eukprot:scaffold10969_cov36-Attheya_sp.AAC.1
MQDGVTHGDVSFYTELVDVHAEDRNSVQPYSFRKPVEIHPITFRTDIYLATKRMEECYSMSIDEEGHCRSPFIVYCSSKSYAYYLIHVLRQMAETRKADPKRIKGMWAGSTISCDFARDFAHNPDAVASQADVLVCTSVIVAGFSITTHFRAFHAFFFLGILSLEEEKQFIRRAHFVITTFPANAVRDSYIWVEKGRGSAFDYERVYMNFDQARKILLTSGYAQFRVWHNSEPGLEETQVRVVTEKAVVRAEHEKLWIAYGATLSSVFNVVEEEESAISIQYKNRWKTWLNNQRMDISNNMQMQLTYDDISLCI